MSSVLPHIDGSPVGQTALVKRLMKGILRQNIALSTYKEAWDMYLVLKYLISLPENPELDLKTISRKLSILLAIRAPTRTSEIVRFDTRFMQFRNNGVIFQFPGLSKTQSDCTPKEVFYAKFNENQKLCIVKSLESFLHITSKFRSSAKTKPCPLLRTLAKPHRGLSANSVASWIKQFLQLAGIDRAIFSDTCRITAELKVETDITASIMSER